MLTTLARIIKYGIQSFRRNVLTSIATIIVMVLALLVFQGLIMFNMLTKIAVQSLQDKIDISVYFKTTVPEDKILEISRSIESLEEVKTVTYVSREKALELFEEKYKGNETISQALDELETNPLLASVNIKARDPNEYGKIAEYINGGFAEEVQKVSYTESRVAIERLNKIVDTAEKMGFALTLFLAFTAILVTFNTIQLAIYSNREEISIMRLVGASNIFIRGPYVVEAVLFGIVATFISMALMIPVIQMSAPYITSFLNDNIETHFYGNFFSFFFYQLLFGIGLGVISGVIAIRRYLRV
jgi:cell division transport system permease protein